MLAGSGPALPLAPSAAEELCLAECEVTPRQIKQVVRILLDSEELDPDYQQSDRPIPDSEKSLGNTQQTYLPEC